MRRWMAAALLAGGTGLLGTAAWEVAEANMAQRALQDRISLPESVASAPVAPPERASPPAAMAEPYRAAPPTYRQGDPLFKLAIPKIAVRNVVVYGSSEAALQVGPGLIEGTPLPGAVGNTVVSAHRDYYFWRLGELEFGDVIRVEAPAGAFTYAVTGKRVVNEHQVEVLEPTEASTISLITCWPLIYAGRSPDRLVVTAVRVDSSPVQQMVE